MGYEIFVRSFHDSDSDGTGDLAGVEAKLDYLDDLGVNLIWLTPIHPSPSYHGYDVTDYLDVNPQLGTLQDFRALAAEARRRGVRIILDLVINHTSSRHPWFVASASSPSNDKRDWYIWREDDPGWKQPWGSHAPVWHQYGTYYYYGLFWEGMPDLNLETPEVLKEVSSIVAFWLEQGASGFRLDAARHLVEDPDGTLCDTRGTHRAAKKIKSAMRRADPRSLLLAEAWTKAETVAAYAGGPQQGEDGKLRRNDEYDLAFNFDLAAVVPTALLAEDPDGVEPVLERTEAAFARRGFDAPFLENHDMDRLVTRLGGREEPLRAAAALLLTLPGTPFIYYGQEIGMANASGCQGDLCRRGPMDWGEVKIQDSDPDSLLNLYRKLIRMRSDKPALTSPHRQRLPTDTPEVYAFSRGSGDQRLLVMLNFSREPKKPRVGNKDYFLPPWGFSILPL